MSENDMGSGDEKFEEFVAREARAYNAPPPVVPRDAMWAAIEAARKDAPTAGTPAARALAAGAPGAAQPGAAMPSRSWRVYASIGMAATLVIGVAIGRFALGTRAASVDTAPAPTAVGPVADTVSTSYQVATTEHLARAEALLTAFGSSTRDAVTDTLLAKWARDVLSNTRLLLDSPAGLDPSRRSLLEDLERVLVQIVQRSPAEGAAAERTHVERTLQRTQVLPRLRSARFVGVNSGT
jgi:hypothetical protein